MKTIDYTPAFDEEVIGWYKAHGWPGNHITMLPPLGLMAVRDDVHCAACWMYVSTCGKTAIMGWPVTNPDVEPLTAAAALVLLVKELKKTACAMGISIVFSYASDRTLLRIFDKAGFVAGDAGMTNMIYLTGV